jgi:sigma54-dependent transcription regulator
LLSAWRHPRTGPLTWHQQFEVAALDVAVGAVGVGATRSLFSASGGRKSSTNDAYRLRKYLARFGMEWSYLAGLR